MMENAYLIIVKITSQLSLFYPKTIRRKINIKFKSSKLNQTTNFRKSKLDYLLAVAMDVVFYNLTVVAQWLNGFMHPVF